MNRLKKVLSEILEVTEDQVTEELAPKDVETWDSFNALAMVLSLEEEFNVKFTMDEVVSIKCVKDIKDILEKHGVEFDGCC